MKRTHKMVLILCTFVCIVFLAGLIPSSKNISPGQGMNIRVVSSSFFQKILSVAMEGPGARIYCETKDGKHGTVQLLQSLFYGPAVFFTGTETNLIYCLYDNDVDIRFLKIDLSKPFNRGELYNSNTYIVEASTWAVQEPTAQDWQIALNFLRAAKPELFKRQSVSAGFRLHSSDDLLKQLKKQHIE